MKKQFVKFIIVLAFLIIGCDGGFEKNELAVFLEFPIDKTPCLEGEKEGLQVIIPFRWSFDGEPKNTQLIIDELDSNKNVINLENQKILELSVAQTVEEVPLDYGKWYQWRIVGNGGNLKSKRYTFYSEGVPQLNRAPFPAEIQIQQRNNGILSFTWLEPIDPENNRLIYDAYFGLTQETPSEIKTNMLEPEILDVPNPEIGTEYFIKIISKEIYQDNSIGNSSIALIKILVEN